MLGGFFTKSDTIVFLDFSSFDTYWKPKWLVYVTIGRDEKAWATYKEENSSTYCPNVLGWKWYQFLMCELGSCPIDIVLLNDLPSKNPLVLLELGVLVTNLDIYNKDGES